jgi:hypothetical protein
MEEGDVNAESTPGEMDALVEGLKRLADAGVESEQLRELLAAVGRGSSTEQVVEALMESFRRLAMEAEECVHYFEIRKITRFYLLITRLLHRRQRPERIREGYPRRLVRPHPTGRRASRRDTNCDDQYGNTTKAGGHTITSHAPPAAQGT